MKALSIHSDFAFDCALGIKTIECRGWQTNYRGDLLICANKQPSCWGAPRGYAVGIVNLSGVHKFTRKDCEGAEMDFVPDDAWAWEFTEPSILRPFEVRGMPGLFNVDDNKLEGFDSIDELVKSYQSITDPKSEFYKWIKDISSDLTIEKAE